MLNLGETGAGGSSDGIDFDGSNDDLHTREIFSSQGAFSASDQMVLLFLGDMEIEEVAVRI